MWAGLQLKILYLVKLGMGWVPVGKVVYGGSVARSSKLEALINPNFTLTA